MREPKATDRAALVLPEERTVDLRFCWRFPPSQRVELPKVGRFGGSRRRLTENQTFRPQLLEPNLPNPDDGHLWWPDLIPVAMRLVPVVVT